MNSIKKNIVPLIILVIGITIMAYTLSKSNSKTAFSVSPQEMLATIDGFEHITKQQALQLDDDDAYVFVDLRSPYEFDLAHIDNAINIPTAFLLEEENMALLKTFFDTKKTVVLYAQTEREAISPWILLYQTGLTNTKVLLGGFECYIDQNADCLTTMPRFDYEKIASQGGIKEVEVIKEKPAPKKKKEIPVTKKVKAQEEGGC